MPTVFVPKESLPGETRVAATPDTVARLVKHGMNVQIQAGAGTGSQITDQDYQNAGATLVSDASAGYGAADLVMKLHPPVDAEISAMKSGTMLVSFIQALNDKAMVEKLRDRGICAFAMELVPRITRAQKMDALSSQANLAGYKAVIMAADRLPRIFPMLTTAAGTIQPAHVVIMGAGVAGLQAIATAKRLGAVVEVSDVRPAVKEQVESLGGKFIEVPTDESAEDAGGYAKEQSEEFLAKQRELVRKKIIKADVVITTAAIPGRPAPKLVTDDMVEEMPEGSVIVDLAAASGGNCTLTEKGETVVKHGVTIIGQLEVPSLVPTNATMVYAKNVLNVVEDMMDKEGTIHVDRSDEVVEGSLVCQNNEVVHGRVCEAHGFTAPAPAVEAQTTTEEG
jgi:proton-translocating NAD(P)+ transhydrogenase subunit alpha